MGENKKIVMKAVENSVKLKKKKQKENKTEKVKKNLEDESENEDVADDFNLNDVLHFGGEQADFDFLLDIDNTGEECIDVDVNEESNEIQDVELRGLLQNILDTEKGNTSSKKQVKIEEVEETSTVVKKTKKKKKVEEVEEDEESKPSIESIPVEQEQITLNTYSTLLM